MEPLTSRELIILAAGVVIGERFNVDEVGRVIVQRLKERGGWTMLKQKEQQKD